MTERNSVRFSYQNQFMLTCPGGRLPVEIGSPLSGSRLIYFNTNENSFGSAREIDDPIKVNRRWHISPPVSINGGNQAERLDTQEEKNSNVNSLGANSSETASIELAVDHPSVGYCSVYEDQSVTKKSTSPPGGSLKVECSEQISNRKDSVDSDRATIISEQASFIACRSFGKNSQSSPSNNFPPGQYSGQLKRFPESAEFHSSIFSGK